MMRLLRKYFRPIHKQKFLDEIDRHTEITRVANQSLDNMMIALDSQISCGCHRTEKDKKLNGTFSSSTPIQCNS